MKRLAGRESPMQPTICMPALCLLRHVSLAPWWSSRRRLGEVRRWWMLRVAGATAAGRRLAHGR